MNGNFLQQLFTTGMAGVDDDFVNNFMDSIQSGVGGFAQQMGVNLGPQDGGNKPPPKTSDKVIAKLPRVKVTNDDLIEENNKSCCICLDEMHVGKEAIKLGCGHIFDEECITDWLKKTCTCPICRYELGTDDKDFEEGRKKRMRERKMRFRENELETYKIGQLKEIMRQNSINTTGCIDKDDLVERIQKSDRVEILSGVERKQLTISSLRMSSIKELKNLLLGVGLGDGIEGSLEKEELVQAIVQSGKFIILPEDHIDNDDNGSSSSSSSCSSSSSGGVNIDYEDREEEAPAFKSKTIETTDSINSDSSNIGCAGGHLSRMMSVDGSYSTSSGNEEKDVDANGAEDFMMEEEALAQAMSLSPALEIPAAASSTVHSSYISAGSSSTSINNHDGGTASMSVKELLGVAKAMGVNTSRCLDKTDLLVALRDAGIN